MRFLLGLFLLFFSWSLAAQCSIQVDIASVECVDGQGVWISFDVEGTGDSAWILREYDQIGGYFTDEIITIGPVQGTSGDTIVLFFEDLTDPENCFLSVPVLVPENCGTTDPCFGFVADVVIDGSGGCGDLENATAFFVGGVGPYAYELSLGNQVLAQDSAYLEDSLTFVNLAAGTYLLAVIDDRNCTTNTRFSVRGAAGLDVNIVPSGDFCAASGEEFTLSAAVANGTPPFTYVWQDGSTTAGVVVPLDFDLTYSVTVADANGCTGTDIWFPDSLINTINWFTPFVLPCDGGSVTISTGDSTDQYEYTWTTPSGNVLFGPTIEATEVGNYFVTGSVAGSRCSVRGVATVISGVLPPAEDISIRADIFEDSLFCGIARCFEVVLPNNVNTRDFRYYWQDADGNPVIDSDRRHIACLETAGVYTVTVASACDSVTLSIVVTNEECGVLSGTVYVDQAGNCSLDAGDDIPAGRVVVLVVADSGEEYYTITDADGAYYIDVPQGTYTLRPITQPDQPFGACEPPLTVTVGSSPTEGADLFLPALLDCPNLTTSVSLPFLRRCFRNFAYVDYRNHGSATAEDATLTVTLDDFFIDVVPSINPTTVDGNTYTFDLGDVPPFAGGQINFLFTVSCEARLGQSHCLESKVTPDAPCNPEENWNGAMVNITEADCNGEEVAFTITNVGDNPMSVPLSYVVVEDGVMMTPQPIESDALNPGANIQVTLPADGTTYQLITNQEPDAPAAEEPTALSEGCGTNPAGTFTTGLANLLALGNGLPAEAIACRANVGAYDPNDKNGFPRGYGAEGNIEPGTRLEFAIRFQNTGTDTAFNVVIRDQIAPEFDLKSFRVESASHDYTVDIDSNRMVTFTFANIMLPDSNVNLAGSQGVINYSIDHAPELQRGDDMQNLAAIYFDFNEPIITNTTSHRIAKSGLPVGTREELAQSVRMDVFPNPTDGLLQVKLPAAEVRLDDVLTVTDVLGRPLFSTTYEKVGRGLDVSRLPQGYYLLVLRGAEDGLAKGRAAFVRR